MRAHTCSGVGSITNSKWPPALREKRKRHWVCEVVSVEGGLQRGNETERERWGGGGVCRAWQTRRRANGRRRQTERGDTAVQWELGLKSRRHHKHQRQTMEAILSAVYSGFSFQTQGYSVGLKYGSFLYNNTVPPLCVEKWGAAVELEHFLNLNLKNPFNIHACNHGGFKWIVPTRCNHPVNQTCHHWNNHCYKTACRAHSWLTDAGFGKAQTQRYNTHRLWF